MTMLLKTGERNGQGEKVLRRPVVQLSGNSPALFVLHTEEACCQMLQRLFSILEVCQISSNGLNLNDLTRRVKNDVIDPPLPTGRAVRPQHFMFVGLDAWTGDE